MSTLAGTANFGPMAVILNPQEVPIMLASVVGVDLKTVAGTNLYTVPSGKTLITTGVVVLVTVADTVTQSPEVSFGKSSNYNEWLGATLLTDLDTANEYVNLNEAFPQQVNTAFVAGDVVGLKVTTGATATTMTGSFYLFGYLI